MTPEKVIIGNAELWHGDCREVLPMLPKVDAVVTDPPYGVNFQGRVTRHNRDSKNGYIGFDDTPENVRDEIVPRFVEAMRIATRACVTTGPKCQRFYPQPDGEGVIWYPAGANRGPWGFTTHQPIYYYGKCPYLARGKGSRPTGFQSSEGAEKNGHPCPKPIGQMTWIVNRASLPGECVLDIFMGSGTTGVACVNIGRKFIGVEITRKHFDIACERIENAQRQQRMFA